MGSGHSQVTSARTLIVKGPYAKAENDAKQATSIPEGATPSF